MAAITADQKRPGEPEVIAYTDAEKAGGVAMPAGGHRDSKDGNGSDSDEFQEGVRNMRAITTIWTKKTLWTMFGLLYLISFVDYLQNAVDSALSPYVTSAFKSHGLLNIASILSTIMGGCAPLALAKLIDIWGRVEGFVFMLLVCVVGTILKAVSNNVSTYVAGGTLYWTGHIGVRYVIGVLLADMTSLKNRMIFIGFSATPRIATAFAGPAIGKLFLEQVNFRWAFGAFAILLIASCVPAIVLLSMMNRKALREGIIEKRPASGRTMLQSFKFYAIEFDILGILILMFALSFLLLPFSLASRAPQQWRTPYIIALIVLGVLLLPVFYIWEAKFAPKQFLPFHYLKQGTIIGSSLLVGTMYLSCFTWNAYFYSYLLIVHRQPIDTAGYIVNTFMLTAAFFAPIVGFVISYTGDFKWTAYAGVPIMLLGTALIIPFRSPSAPVGMLVFTQFLVGLGSEIFTACSTLAIMAPVTHQYIAAVNAIGGLFGSVGAAIGFAIAGAMWNNMVPQELTNRLPEGLKGNASAIFADINIQGSFADGSPEREAVVGAYSHVMRLMVIVGAAFMPLCVLCVFAWKNINVKKIEEEQGKQTKGNTI
ncbi:siderophore iron transporter mirB [Cordyceps fumosorosea ARSEF 2679]|uniref:Siderophore iron transporter mirB n=1 Tax=Cordyceps fumosorosea (strain ARSEF 2679) TaxID=1081104 RepID=A0A168DC73_CORFA|nr:siderophore iron transporter mirB [Cordyceps fumosorosea ARSEF 2679]OAA72426.1 siderophore iron transporter mirB [Cordyceps fumosorosea ARSEF 2679]